MRDDDGTTIGALLQVLGALLIVCGGVAGIQGVYNLQSDVAATKFEGWIYVAAALGSGLHGITLIGFGVLIDLQAATQAHLKRLVEYTTGPQTIAAANTAPAVPAALSQSQKRPAPVPPDGAPYASLIDPEPVEDSMHRGRQMKILADGSVIVEKPTGWWRYPSLADLNRYGGR